MPSNKSVSDAPIVQFTNCRILRSHQLQREDLWVRQGKILNPEKLFFDEKGSADIQLDCKDSIIAPGFIDVQINGGFGVDFSLATDDFKSGIDLVSQKILSHGVTSFCPTLVTSPPSVYHQVLPQLSIRNGGAHGAGILGAHLEGPFISKEKKGAHPEHCLRTFEAGAFQDLLATYGSLDCVRIVTLAPEMKRSSEVIQELTQRGICVSLGHSVANLAQAEEAVQHGATFITHLFNAMLPFHHRDPGIVGLLTSDKIPAGRRVFYGMISDGIHTNPAALRIAHRAHPKGMVLVTDAIAGMGLAPGRHTLGQQVVVIDGLNTYIAGTKTLSGSVATMDTCVRHFQEATGCSVETALEAASLHPAQLLGIEHKKGTLNYDSDADFLMLNDDLYVQATYIAGSPRHVPRQAGVVHFPAGGKSSPQPNPTTSAAEETRHTINVLHSHETPFTKKQQVINHVFGNYRLKMANDQKSTEKAETAPEDETVAEKSTGGGAAQKKKKKKQKPSANKKIEQTEVNRKAKEEANGCQNKDTSHQDETSQQSDDQLWKEVSWCVEQLELGLKTQKPTPKQAEEAVRAIKTLRSDKAPLVKKRQLMRTMFGDYRKKMEEDWCKELKLMEAALKSATIVEVKRDIRNKNGRFIRKCSGAYRKSQASAESPSESPRTLNTGPFKFLNCQEEFRFNFF
ncbi:Amdhd2 [Columba livia]|nr:Amdhd2 [Columba livia]